MLQGQASISGRKLLGLTRISCPAPLNLWLFSGRLPSSLYAGVNSLIPKVNGTVNPAEFPWAKNSGATKWGCDPGNSLRKTCELKVGDTYKYLGTRVDAFGANITPVEYLFKSLDNVSKAPLNLQQRLHCQRTLRARGQPSAGTLGTLEQAS